MDKTTILSMHKRSEEQVLQRVLKKFMQFLGWCFLVLLGYDFFFFLKEIIS